MAEAQKDGEQSMDDILASIRKIISSEPHENDTRASGSETGADDLSDILAPSDAGGSVGSGFGASPATLEDFQPTKVQSGTTRENSAYDRGEATNSLQSKLASLDTARGLRRPEPTEQMAPTEEVITAVPVDDSRRGASLASPDDEEADNASDIVTLESKISAATEAVLKKSEPVADTVEWEPTATTNPTDGAEGFQPSEVSNVADHSAASSAAAALASALAHTAGTKSVEMGRDDAVDDPGSASVVREAASDAKTDVVTPVVSLASAVGADRSVDGSLEAVVVKALEPMLREWIDANLPRLVEERLQGEMERQSAALKSTSGE